MLLERHCCFLGLIVQSSTGAAAAGASLLLATCCLGPILRVQYPSTGAPAAGAALLLHHTTEHDSHAPLRGNGRRMQSCSKDGTSNLVALLTTHSPLAKLHTKAEAGREAWC